MTPGSLALAFAAALAGAGLYVNGVEQPARLSLDGEALLKEWGPSDRRGVALLAGLSLLARRWASPPFSRAATCVTSSARSSRWRAGPTPST